MIGVGVLAMVVAIATFGLSANAAHQPNHDAAAVIAVVFTPDDMGFEATSSKDVSNVWVQYCDLSRHEHTGLTGLVYNHTELQVIRGVWVKSGSNGNEANDPPGAGAFFANSGACVVITTTPPTTPPLTTSPSTTTPPSTTPPTTTPPTTSPPSTTSPNTTTTVPTTEIPFFPSGTALVLASIGAIGGAFLVMRRKN